MQSWPPRFIVGRHSCSAGISVSLRSPIFHETWWKDAAMGHGRTDSEVGYINCFPLSFTQSIWPELMSALSDRPSSFHLRTSGRHDGTRSFCMWAKDFGCFPDCRSLITSISIALCCGRTNSGGLNGEVIYEVLPVCCLSSMQPQCKHPDTAHTDYK